MTYESEKFLEATASLDKIWRPGVSGFIASQKHQAIIDHAESRLDSLLKSEDRSLLWKQQFSDALDAWKSSWIVALNIWKRSNK